MSTTRHEQQIGGHLVAFEYDGEHYRVYVAGEERACWGKRDAIPFVEIDGKSLELPAGSLPRFVIDEAEFERLRALVTDKYLPMAGNAVAGWLKDQLVPPRNRTPDSEEESP